MMTEATAVLEQERVAPFLIKLFEIVSSAQCDHLISWSPHGETFRIIDRTLFAQEVLPRYFKHDNLRSFIRQLNIYGFQRVPNQSGRDRTMEFFHPMFARHGVHNLKEIKRGVAQTKKDESAQQPGFLEHQGADAEAAPPSKKSRGAADYDRQYAAYQKDVNRMQNSLADFERDMRVHTMGVQQKLSSILTALGDDENLPQPTACRPSALRALPSAADISRLCALPSSAEMSRLAFGGGAAAHEGPAPHLVQHLVEATRSLPSDKLREFYSLLERRGNSPLGSTSHLVASLNNRLSSSLNSSPAASALMSRLPSQTCLAALDRHSAAVPAGGPVAE